MPDACLASIIDSGAASFRVSSTFRLVKEIQQSALMLASGHVPYSAAAEASITLKTLTLDDRAKFGKHKGTRWRIVPQDYLEWLRDSGPECHKELAKRVLELQVLELQAAPVQD